MELSLKQRQIVEDDSDKIVVIAAAASGKTATMAEKVRRLLQKGVNPKEIVVITFTNMAAEELRSRLADDFTSDMFIGTIHSLANYFLMASGVDTSKYLNDEKFDKLFSLVKKHPNCIRPVSFLLLDEAQDSTPLEFEFIFDMIKPKSFVVVGDRRQSIYQWRGSVPSLLTNLSKQDGVVTYDLNENYRNSKQILAYAKKIIQPTGMFDTSIARMPLEGSVAQLDYSLQTIKRYLERLKDKGSWAILTRTNSQANLIEDFLRDEGFKVDSFKQGQLTREELVEKMASDSIKVLTIHSAKGLEWDYVCVVGARYFSEEERCIAYVAATRARKGLMWMSMPKKRKTYNWE